MARESRMINRLFGEAEAAFDWARYQIRQRREPGQYHIQAYRGHGTADMLYLSGRVFEGHPVPAAREDDAMLRNFWHTVRRLGSDEVPAARIRASVHGRSQTVLADEEGFFEVALPATTQSQNAEVWREVELELVDPLPPVGKVRTPGYSIVPPAEAQFGIISDIDDTVVQTDVANVLRMLRLVLLTNAHTRLPFAGVAAFYRALHIGAAGPFTNPLFYVSSSPWNFYDLLNEVFEVHRIPVGPLFLKDYGLARDLLLSRGHVEHKLAAIDHILNTHAHLPFVLVGDSGQKDPEIYRETVRRHPGRVQAIYIRDVSPDLRDQEVRSIAAELTREGVEMILVSDTRAAAQHAADHGFIDPACLPEISGERAMDLGKPGPVRGAVEKATEPSDS